MSMQSISELPSHPCLENDCPSFDQHIIDAEGDPTNPETRAAQIASCNRMRAAAETPIRQIGDIVFENPIQPTVDWDKCMIAGVYGLYLKEDQ